MNVSTTPGSGERLRMLSVDNLVNQVTRNTESPLSDVVLPSDFNFSLSDANLLYNDLNDIVNSRLEEALTPTLRTYIEETSANPFNTEFSSDFDETDRPGKDIIVNIPLDYFALGDPHNHYLAFYYHDFSTTLSPLMPNIGLNPIRDVLLNYAKREPYLLYAILACGARTAFRKSSKIEDDQAYCSYLSSCLNILSENFSKENLRTETVEPMLLTILLLTSDSASSKNTKWRAHLKGAKELFKKINVQTDTINFCKNWVIGYEVLAGITNAYGGIFQSENDNLDKFISNDAGYIKSLKKLRMIDLHGFNYLNGHIIDLDLVFCQIIKILNKIRDYKKKQKQGNLPIKSHLSSDLLPNIVTYETIETLMIELNNLQNREIIHKSGIIPHSNPNHPSKTSAFQNFQSIQTITINNEPITYSWYDISHQCHTIAAKLVLMTRIMEQPKTSILVQSLVKQVLKFIEVLNQVENFDNVCITHLNFVIVLVGRSSIYPQDQELIRKFLKLGYSMGLESCEHNLGKLEKKWANNNDDDTDEEEEEDVLTW
ncbi:Lysine biosynthesis regulatory protein [Wickerhamomyces ciferrii]|uniref:Lysine biosynthesis regulatory protein n=1 Tax=Wickerhamomyces ciferrii (strain ATCC 14091 / BCRC 22168 / CBS 111 / JCM 3599 / NBRC 0793 / NRRL Y-1031 F-60-10) TaxID=1206466 RepID=K0KEJ2_WICCF|nr:Lysine biosynthesis regulatory protein [Wickerhamomyces ciferrii]CCH41326.1 Lysine biosynthesis regulatory protein [Wickerhamomyces ciferrii]